MRTWTPTWRTPRHLWTQKTDAMDRFVPDFRILNSETDMKVFALKHLIGLVGGKKAMDALLKKAFECGQLARGSYIHMQSAVDEAYRFRYALKTVPDDVVCPAIKRDSLKRFIEERRLKGKGRI